MGLDQPVVHWICGRNGVVVNCESSHTNHVIHQAESSNLRCAGDNVDAFTAHVQLHQLAPGVVGTCPNNKQDVGVSSNETQDMWRKVSCGGGSELLSHNRCATCQGLRHKGCYPGAAKSGVGSESCYLDARPSYDVGHSNGVLCGVSAGAKHVAIPEMAGNDISRGGFHDDDALKLLRDWPYGNRVGGRSDSNEDIYLILVEEFESALSSYRRDGGRILPYYLDFASGDFHFALGHEFQTELKAAPKLRAVVLQNPA